MLKRTMHYARLIGVCQRTVHSSFSHWVMKNPLITFVKPFLLQYFGRIGIEFWTSTRLQKKREQTMRKKLFEQVFVPSIQTATIVSASWWGKESFDDFTSRLNFCGNKKKKKKIQEKNERRSVSIGIWVCAIRNSRLLGFIGIDELPRN